MLGGVIIARDLPACSNPRYVVSIECVAVCEGLRKKTVAPGASGLEDHLRNSGSTDLFGSADAIVKHLLEVSPVPWHFDTCIFPFSCVCSTCIYCISAIICWLSHYENSCYTTSLCRCMHYMRSVCCVGS